MLRINLQTELCNELYPPSIFLLLLPSYFLTSSICHCFLLSCPTPSLPSFHPPFSTNILSYPYLSSFLPSNLSFTPFLTSSLLPSQYSFQFTSFFSNLDLFLSIGMRESSTHCSEYLQFQDLSKLIYILNTHIHAYTQRFPQITMVFSPLLFFFSRLHYFPLQHTIYHPPLHPSFSCLLPSISHLSTLLQTTDNLFHFISFYFSVLYSTPLYSSLFYSTPLTTEREALYNVNTIT